MQRFGGKACSNKPWDDLAFCRADCEILLTTQMTQFAAMPFAAMPCVLSCATVGLRVCQQILLTNHMLRLRTAQ
jgi:hypothetical protein